MQRFMNRLARVVILTSMVGVALASSAGPALAGIEYRTTLTSDAVHPGPGDPAVGGSASMGFHPEDGLACVTAEFTDFVAPTAVTIGLGTPESAGAPVITFNVTGEEDEFYSGCIDAAPALLEAIIASPSSYFLQVSTEAFPGGAARGQVEAIDTGIRVSFAQMICPGKVRTLADVNPETFAPCVGAIRTGDLGPAPDGYRYDPRPVVFDMAAQLTDEFGTRTLGDTEIEGGGVCNPETRRCSIGFAYVWPGVLGDELEVRQLSAPQGYSFGDALVFVDGSRIDADVDRSNASVSFDASGAIDNATVFVFDFRGPTK
jgi:hypothetical protein